MHGVSPMPSPGRGRSMPIIPGPRHRTWIHCLPAPQSCPVRSLALAPPRIEIHTLPYHTSSRVVHDGAGRFFVDKVAIRVYPNDASKPPGGGGGFFPIAKPMYIFSSIWNADDWATRGGLEKTDWAKAPFVSSYRDFAADACAWPPTPAGGAPSPPTPACAAATGDSWWDQPPAWALDAGQRLDNAWVARNLLVYDYCDDRKRFPTPPEECALRAAATAS